MEILENPYIGLAIFLVVGFLLVRIPINSAMRKRD
jgi:hypothetical protein